MTLLLLYLNMPLRWAQCPFLSFFVMDWVRFLLAYLQNSILLFVATCPTHRSPNFDETRVIDVEVLVTDRQFGIPEPSVAVSTPEVEDSHLLQSTNIGRVIGVTVAITLSVVAVLLGAVYCWKRRQRRTICENTVPPDEDATFMATTSEEPRIYPFSRPSTDLRPVFTWPVWVTVQTKLQSYLISPHFGYRRTTWVLPWQNNKTCSWNNSYVLRYLALRNV